MTIRRAVRMCLEYTAGFPGLMSDVLSSGAKIGVELGAGFRSVQIDLRDRFEGRLLPPSTPSATGRWCPWKIRRAPGFERSGGFFFVGWLVHPFALNVFAQSVRLLEAQEEGGYGGRLADHLLMNSALDQILLHARRRPNFSFSTRIRR